MQINVTVSLRQVPQEADAQSIGQTLSSVLSGLAGGSVQVIVNDRDHAQQWDRWNVVREMNKGITLPGQEPGFESDEDRIQLFRGRRR